MPEAVVLRQARKLARALAESPAAQRVCDAEAAILADERLCEQVASLRALEERLRSVDFRTPAEGAELRRRARELQDLLKKEPRYRAYLAARTRLDRYAKQALAAISRALLAEGDGPGDAAAVAAVELPAREARSRGDERGGAGRTGRPGGRAGGRASEEARALVAAFAQCRATADLRAARQAVLADDSLQETLAALLERHERLRLHAYASFDEGKQLYAEVCALEGRLASHLTYQRFRRAQAAVAELADTVLDILAFALTGREHTGGCTKNQHPGPAGVVSCEECGKTSVPLRGGWQPAVAVQRSHCH